MVKVNGKIKHLAMAVVDAVLILSAVALGLYLRFDWNVPTMWIDKLEALLLPAVILNLVIFYLFGFFDFLLDSY